MRLRRVFLSDAPEINHLILRQSHYQDGVLLLAVVVHVPHGHDTVRFVLTLLQHDIVRCHFARVHIGWTLLLQSVPHAALIAEVFTSTLLMRHKLVDTFTDDWHETDSMCNELIVENGGVLFDLHKIDCHR